MGNVIAIGLTSRTGIVIGRLLNAQLHHMSVRLRGGINNFYFGHRHAVGKLHNTVWFYKVCWSFPSHFPSLLNTFSSALHLFLDSFQIFLNSVCLFLPSALMLNVSNSPRAFFS